MRILTALLLVMSTIPLLVIDLPRADSIPAGLPQSSTSTTYAPGSLVIDMGMTPQTTANALTPYAMVYDLLVHHQIPVAWAINSGKTAVAQPDFTASNLVNLQTGATVSSKTFSGSAFIVPAGFAADVLKIFNAGHVDTYTPPLTSTAKTWTYASWKSKGVQLYKASSGVTAPQYSLISTFPRVVLDAQNGKLAQAWYDAAGFPTYAYQYKGPAALTPCDDLYVMPHADPTWSTHSNLLAFNNSGGGIWAGCHAVSVLENLFNPSNPTQRMNFLSGDAVTLTDSEAVSTRTAAPTGALQLLVSQVRKDADGNGFGEVGDTITYTYTVINRGTTALSGVAVRDMVGTTPVCTVNVAAGAQTTCNRTYTLTTADQTAGSVTNPVSAAPASGTPSSSESLTTATGAQVPNRGLQVLKTALRADTDTTKNGFGDPGDTITYSYWVYNPGPSLTTVKVLDDRLGAITCPATTLAGGASMTCTSKVVTLTQAQVDGQKIDNLATVSGLAPAGLVPFGSHGDGTPPYSYSSWSDPVMQFMDLPTAAQQNGSEQIYIPYTGWRPTTSVLGWDPDQADVVANGGKGGFGPAASMVYGRGFGNTTNGLVMYQAGHNLTSIGYVPASIAAVRAFFDFNLLVGVDRGIKVTSSVPASVDYPTPPVPVSATATGGNGTYTYKWTSSCGGTFANPTAASTTFTPPKVTTSTACVLRVVVTDSCGRVTFDANPIQVVPSPNISITKNVVSVTGPVASTGLFTVKYSITLSNSGSGVGSYGLVTDTPRFASNLVPTQLSWTGPTGTPGTVTGAGPYTLAGTGRAALDPGASDVYTIEVSFKYTNSSQATACGGSGTGLDNLASTTTAKGTVTAEACANPPPPPGAISIDKTWALTTDVNGNGKFDYNADPTKRDVITWYFKVTNTGTVDLNNITVTDTSLDGANPGFTITCPSGILSPGASVNCSSVAWPVPNSNDFHSNTAVATGTTPTNAQVTATDTEVAYQPVDGIPQLTITKTPNPSSYDLNTGTITYSIVVSNTGQKTANGIVVSDPMFTTLSNCTSAFNLNAGQSRTCTGTYTLTSADLASGRTIPNTVTAAATNASSVSASAAVPSKPVTIGDKVWIDSNANGIQDAGESGLQGVAVTVVNVGTGASQTVTSSSTGAWSVGGTGSGFFAGTYRVTYDYSAVAAFYVPTTEGQGTTATDSNPTGDSYALRAGESNITVDFGLTPKPVLKLTKSWSLKTDLNSNGKADAGDTVTYTFVVENTGYATISSTSLSDPMFNDGADITCTPSTLTPRVVPNTSGGGTATCTSQDHVVTVNDALTGQVANTATVTGTAPGGTTVRDTSTVSYPVQQMASLGDRVWADLNGNNIQDKDGNGNFKEPGIPDVQITVTGPGGPYTATTDSNGAWLLAVPAGTYTVSYVGSTVPTGYSASTPLAGSDTAVDSNPQGASYTLAAGASDLTIDFGFTPGPVTVGNFVWDDVNGNGIQDTGELGIPGVKIMVVNGTTGDSTEATTDADGHWSVTVPAGTYLVSYDEATLPAGYTSSPPEQGSDNAVDSNGSGVDYEWDPNSTDNTVDFGFYGTPGLTLHKTAALPAGDQLADPGDHITYTFTVTNTGQTTLTLVSVTDPMFPGTPFPCTPATLAPGAEADCGGTTYTVTGSETLTADGKIANTATAFGSGPNGTTAQDDDTAAVAVGAGLGDLVWVDANADGLQAWGEGGLANVTVTATDTTTGATFTTTTDSVGHWSLRVPAGTYAVTYAAPTGYVATLVEQGADRSIDSSASGVVVTVTAGFTDTTVDFGLLTPKVISLHKLAENCDTNLPTCPLGGGSFALYSSDPTDGTASPIADGITPDQPGGATFTSVPLAVNQDYWLVETKTPAGFNLLAQPIALHLATSGITLAPPGSDLIVVRAPAPFTVEVTDVPASSLPKAGGRGFGPYLALGLLLIVAPFVAYARPRRRAVRVRGEDGLIRGPGRPPRHAMNSSRTNRWMTREGKQS